MKKSIMILMFVSVAMVCGCTSAKVNYKIDNQGNMVVEKTEDGKHGISDDAPTASYDAATYERNMSIKLMWKKYGQLIETGKYQEAGKLLKIIKNINGEEAREKEAERKKSEEFSEKEKKPSTTQGERLFNK